MKKDYCTKVAAFAESFVGKEGYELLKTEFVNEDGLWYLRLYIDLTEKEREKRRKKLEAQKEEERAQEEAQEDLPGEDLFPEEDGTDENEITEEDIEPAIGINDCAFVSRRISKWLDQEDFIEEVYTLEVCSRGYLEEN